MLGKRTRRSEFLADIHSAKLMQTPYLLISTLKNLIVCGQSDELSQDEKRRRKEIDQGNKKRSLLNDLVDSIGDMFTYPSTEDRILILEAYAFENMWWYPLTSPPDVPKANILSSDRLYSILLWKNIKSLLSEKITLFALYGVLFLLVRVSIQRSICLNTVALLIDILRNRN